MQTYHKGDCSGKHFHYQKIIKISKKNFDSMKFNNIFVRKD